MSTLIRFGVSVEKSLLDDFDQHILKHQYQNRSEAIRDLIRESLVKEEWNDDHEVAGALTITYDHEKRELVHKLLSIQHDFQENIISAQHIHLDQHNCLEILAIKGRARIIQELSNKLKAQIGVKHVTLHMSFGTETMDQ